MKDVRRFTVSVPGDLLEALDEKLVRDAESRSAVVRRLVEDALRELEEQGEIERYVEGYRKQPQTEEEFGWSDEVVIEQPAQDPWP
ncbi:MAG: CopG family ribbon-helix-helix protein [Dehalococcoidia bacterium]